MTGRAVQGADEGGLSCPESGGEGQKWPVLSWGWGGWRTVAWINKWAWRRGVLCKPASPSPCRHRPHDPPAKAGPLVTVCTRKGGLRELKPLLWAQGRPPWSQLTCLWEILELSQRPRSQSRDWICAKEACLSARTAQGPHDHAQEQSTGLLLLSLEPRTQTRSSGICRKAAAQSRLPEKNVLREAAEGRGHGHTPERPQLP